MGDYFKPLRRRVGILLLAISCVLTAGWVRSDSTIDLLQVSFGPVRCAFVSGSARFRMILPLDDELSLFISQVLNGHNVTMVFVINSRSFEDTPIFMTSQKGHLAQASYAEQQVTMIPYWSIVIPLTLISCYLILSNQRKETSTPKHLHE